MLAPDAPVDPFDKIQIGIIPPVVSGASVYAYTNARTDTGKSPAEELPNQTSEVLEAAALPVPSGSVIGGSSAEPDTLPDLASDFVRLFSTEVPDHVRRKTKDDVYTRLDRDGPGYYLEEIARGAIPVEIAFRYEMPVVFFMRWLQERADVEDYNYAMTLCADSLAAKSRAVLELAPDSAAEGQMIREYAKRALDLAERIAPDGWSGSKKPKGDVVGQAAIQIAIIMPSNDVAQGRTIPGLELLGGKPAVPAPATPESGNPA